MLHGEDLIHVAIRRFLTKSKWTLLAGQYPGGSDNHLSRLYIRDPTVARDQSPDPRRHSRETFIPDLVAIKDDTILLVEMKPTFSVSDAEKLRKIRGPRFADLKRALHEQLGIEIDKPDQVQCGLGFSYDSPFFHLADMRLFRVESLEIVHEEQ